MYLERNFYVDFFLQTRIFGDKGNNGQVRNEKMRQWVATQRGELAADNVHFVDFDRMARSENAPVGVGSLNW